METKTRDIKDYRKLRYCPRCGGWSASHPGQRYDLQVMTHLFKNWDEVNRREAERRKLWVGKPPERLELKTLSYQCLCFMCGWSAYYLADTGQRCDIRGRRVAKRRGPKKRR